MKTRETRSRMLTEALAVAGVMASLTGCPQPTQDTPDAFRVPDAFVAADAAMPDDVGNDAPVAVDAPLPDAGPPDAGPERCTSEGMFRRVACACGGMQSDRCVGGVWTVAVACDGTGECAPGAFETNEQVEICRIQQRECSDACVWGAWYDVVPEGECNNGAGDECGLIAGRPTNCRCMADCTCGPVPGCGLPVGR
jgi:hypothetical protein